VALKRYQAEVRALAVSIASSRSIVDVSPELEASIARDERELPEYAAEFGNRNEREPYRRKLSFMWWRLGNDLHSTPADLLDTVIVSRSESAADATAVLDLTDEPVSVVPLFETVADLRAAPEILRELLADERYGRRVAERGGKLEVMVGYSDSGKDGGYITA